MAQSAAAMFAGAAFLGVLEAIVPGGPHAPLLPALLALLVAPLVVIVGPRLDRAVMFWVGPLGAAMIASSLADADYAGDGAVLYMWPVVWVAHFYGRRATAGMIGAVGVAHAMALSAMAPGLGNADRWLDVVVCVTLVAATIRWLTERHERLLGRVRSEARMDVLTGVANRRGFDEAFPRLLERAQRDGEPMAVVSLDLDHFKAINDCHGHEIGDRVLASVGRTLRARARAGDLVARTGGEEFVVALPGLDCEAAATVAERIRTEVSHAGAGEHPAATVSAGVAALPAGGAVTAEVLLASADAALYDAKRAGRNQTVAVTVAPVLVAVP